MEAVVLAGGFGTRLAHIVKDVPKPMAPVAGRPFLEYVLDYLSGQGVSSVILATGYMHEKIACHFKDDFKGVKLLYSIEESPLGTGGAIKKALTLCSDRYVFIINGDTFFDVNLQEMYRATKKSGTDITIAIKQMKDFDRYGTVKFDDNDIIISFAEKKYCTEGWINGGVYCIKKDALEMISDEKFSFENDYLENENIHKKIGCIKQNGYFIDIGIESDYNKAQKDFRNGIKNV